ncbi:MAG TPA: hypothetical protein VJH05_02195 [Candidatus Paceibacterota bacterium]
MDIPVEGRHVTGLEQIKVGDIILISLSSENERFKIALVTHKRSFKVIETNIGMELFQYKKEQYQFFMFWKGKNTQNHISNLRILNVNELALFADFLATTLNNMPISNITGAL